MIIISDTNGWLANRLLLFSSFIVFAKENNIPILYSGFAHYAHYFESTKNSLICSFPPSKKKFGTAFFRKLIYVFIYYFTHLMMRINNFLLKHFSLKNKLFNTIHLELNNSFDLGNYNNIDLLKSCYATAVMGWPYKYSDPSIYFRHHSTIIKYFTPIKSTIDRVQNMIAEFKKDNTLLIGVHIRRGDYASFEGGKYYFSDDIYIKYMQQCNNIFSQYRIRFLIHSDEKIILNHFIMENLDAKKGPGVVIEDLYSLASCNYIIAPPSTFSIWASFYGQVPLYMIKNTHDDILSVHDFKICSIS